VAKEMASGTTHFRDYVHVLHESLINEGKLINPSRYIYRNGGY
jgi:hypothetical protein